MGDTVLELRPKDAKETEVLRSRASQKSDATSAVRLYNCEAREKGMPRRQPSSERPQHAE